MTTGIANSKTTDEVQIRALIDDRAKAVREKNVNEAISSIAPGILSFDVVNPFQQMGADASKKRAEDWFSSFEGPIGYEIRDLSITAGDSVAFSHASAMLAQRGQTEDNSMWWHTTVCFHKLTRSGWSRMSITRSPLTWRAARCRWISSHSSWRSGRNLAVDERKSYSGGNRNLV